MGLRARYDPKEDRMLVTIEAGEGGKAQSVWLTRRQWVGLLHQMGVLQLGMTDDGEEPPAPRKTPPPALPPQPDARRVDGARLRKEDDGARLVFALGDNKGLGVHLPQPRLPGFRRMLEQQAERAGWDTRAGLQRLDAGLTAQAVMRKAKGQP